MCCSPETPKVFYFTCWQCRRVEAHANSFAHTASFYLIPEILCKVCGAMGVVSYELPEFPPPIDSLPGTPVDSDFAAKLEPRA